MHLYNWKFTINENNVIITHSFQNQDSTKFGTMGFGSESGKRNMKFKNEYITKNIIIRSVIIKGTNISIFDNNKIEYTLNWDNRYKNPKFDHHVSFSKLLNDLNACKKRKLIE